MKEKASAREAAARIAVGYRAEVQDIAAAQTAQLAIDQKISSLNLLSRNLPRKNASTGVALGESR